MPFFGAKIDIDDKDLLLVEAIVKRVCKSIDGMSEAIAKVAEAVEKKKMRLE